MVIHETKHYSIKVVTEPEGKYQVYGVINKLYGVCEAYISALPRAIQMTDALEYALAHPAPPIGSIEAELEERILAGLRDNERRAKKPSKAN